MPDEVGLHRGVDEVLQFRELDDLVKAAGDLALVSRSMMRDEDVLAARDLGWKAGAQFDEGRESGPATDTCPWWAS